MHENYIRCDHKLENGAQCEERHRSTMGGGMGGLPEGWVTVMRHIRVTPEQALGRGGHMPDMIDAIVDASAKMAETEDKADKLTEMSGAYKAALGEMAMKMSPTRCVQSHLCPSHAPTISVVESDADAFGIGLPSLYCP